MTHAELWDAFHDHPRELMEMVELRQPNPARERKWKLAICEAAQRAVAAHTLQIDEAVFRSIYAFLDGEMPLAKFELYRESDPIGLLDVPYDVSNRLVVAAGAARAALHVADADCSQLFDCFYWQYAEYAFADPVSETVIQAAIFKDIFGNPFRPVAFDPAWRTEHTVGLAAKMYDDRDFRAMPILADALEEVGCENADILTHCREPGVHVRGCWVVDLLLGKSS